MMPQHVIVVDSSPQWTFMYEEEKEKVMAVLKENAIAIYHIGSTAYLGWRQSRWSTSWRQSAALKRWMRRQEIF